MTLNPTWVKSNQKQFLQNNLGGGGYHRPPLKKMRPLAIKLYLWKCFEKLAILSKSVKIKILLLGKWCSRTSFGHNNQTKTDRALWFILLDQIEQTWVYILVSGQSDVRFRRNHDFSIKDDDSKQYKTTSRISQNYFKSTSRSSLALLYSSLVTLFCHEKGQLSKPCIFSYFYSVSDQSLVKSDCYIWLYLSSSQL